MKLYILIACHNRLELTTRALQQVQDAAGDAAMDVRIVVFDDGSTDGTAAAIRSMQGPITLLEGDGSAFWARSMHEAEKHVLERAAAEDSDFLLWLNDDVDLDRASFQAMLRDARHDRVTVGATLDPTNGSVTYSGLRRSGIHPLNFERIDPTDQSGTVDTFNGNCVLVPVGLARKIGGIDGRFSHGLADIDYGLRCSRLDIPVVLAPRPIGRCARNPAPARQSAWHDWQSFRGAKGGGNFHSLRLILSKSHPWTWFLPVAASYASWWARRAKSALR
ncbi:glycosyltransferase family 2 protein [Curtobacterium sp. MCBA15_012]|uniref:glycosyltransferase family 2 protein n=1 Tax=Curtobacterium sp. MCBA15_012 TaxID=1898738 RepID=UPI0015879B01|nr:glycosyltransferase [Curtobacterium sp. MCBA15_012]WIB00734.1 glycosyltransferase [Curtobacterium sp. MCBA15_012]